MLKTDTNIDNKKEIFFTIFVFTLFFLIACYKLLNSSLWFDETIEYWYSKIMFGKLPYGIDFGKETSNMYQRIVQTYQPPLYNFVMFFWLKIYDSEWWFRFSGVVFGLIGMIGLFKTVYLISEDSYLASLSIIFATFTWRLIYYYQECAEYTLLLSTLFWNIYFFVRLLKEVTVKNIILFTVSCILPVYSQYGAIFPVFCFLVTALIFVLAKKNKKSSKCIVISYLIAFFAFALPLFIFFLRPQLLNQQKNNSGIHKIFFEENFFFDFLDNFIKVVKWNFFENFSDECVRIFAFFFIIMVILSLVLGKNKIIKIYEIVNICVYCLYYLTVKLGFYANINYMPDPFGNRYNLFFIPLWIVIFFFVLIEIYSFLINISGKKIGKLVSLYSNVIFASISVCFIFCYSYLNWNNKLSYNWNKEDARGSVENWYKNKGYEYPTLTNNGSANAFCYYVRHSKQNFPDVEKNVHYMNSKNKSEFIKWFNDKYPDKPERVFFFITHGSDYEKYINWLSELGYGNKLIYKRNLYSFELKEISNEKLIKAAIKTNENKARIDIKNIGGESNKIKVLNNSDIKNTFKAQNWATDKTGTGYMITSEDFLLNSRLKMIGNGKLKITLRGVDWKDLDKKRIPMKINFTKLTVNGKTVLDKKTTIWHDKPFNYEIPVKDGEIITLHAEWEPYTE